jgi:DNA/RNA endonuclease YhcR with UshA esterase domain
MSTQSRFAVAGVALSLALGSSAGLAHHSFAAHYDSTKPITKQGVVTEFRFTNPHGILMLDVTNEAGKVEHWTVETTAPVFMRRFGWTKDLVKPGDQVIVDGWASRDGSHLMRIRSVKRADGTPVGTGSQEAGSQ